jgi:hypothetical protein
LEEYYFITGQQIKQLAMTERIQNIMKLISDELMNQFPEENPKIAALTDDSFTYELEKHGNFTYFMVGYNIDPSGTLTIDWDNAELAVI